MNIRLIASDLDGTLLTDKKDKSIGCEPDGERNSRGRDL